MATRGNFGVGPQGPPGLSTGPAGGDLGGTYPDPTLQATANVANVVQLNRLDQLAAPTANVNMNSRKLTNLANGVLPTDAINLSQIPTALPAVGPAGGDLTGTYPNPTITGTSNVNTVVRANRLDQMAVPSASVNINNQKIINVANGTSAGDAVNFGQLPGSLPPTGAATGDLSGTYPAPTVAKLNGVTASGTPGFGKVLAADTSSTASWQITPGLTASTGVISGGTMTVNGSNPSAFDIVQTIGYVADYTTNPASPTITKVVIPAQTVIITGTPATRGTNWWAADANGTITSVGANPLTETQRRNMIQLGATASVVGTGVIVAIAGVPIQITQPQNQLVDLLNSLGPFSISGNLISFNGANLAFNKSAGTAFFPNFASASTPNNPHIVTSAAETGASFRYATRLSGSTSGAFVNVLDPGHYDVGGVITAVPGGGATSTIQRVYLFGTGTSPTQLVVQYGQSTHSSLATALSAIGTTNYTVDPDFAGVGTLLGWIVMTKSATDLSNSGQAAFVQAAKFAIP